MAVKACKTSNKCQGQTQEMLTMLTSAFWLDYNPQCGLKNYIGWIQDILKIKTWIWGWKHWKTKKISRVFKKCFRMYSKCIQNVFKIWSKCIKNVSKMYSKFVQNSNLLKMYPKCNQLYPKCIQMYPNYVQNVFVFKSYSNLVTIFTVSKLYPK